MKVPLTINSRGVITLPAKLREALGLKPNDQFIAETRPEGLLLRPAVALPIEVYTPARQREFEEAEAELAGWPARELPVQRRYARKKSSVEPADAGVPGRQRAVFGGKVERHVATPAARTAGARPRMLGG